MKVAVEYMKLNEYRVRVDDGAWQQVEASLSQDARGVRLTTTVDGERRTVGLLTHQNQIHVYDEVIYCSIPR